MLNNVNAEHDSRKELLKKLFILFPIKNVMQFGIDDVSRFLLQKNRKVSSLEIYTSDLPLEGVAEKLDILQGIENPNWKPSIRICKNEYTPVVGMKVRHALKGKFDLVYIDTPVSFKEFLVAEAMDKKVDFVVARLNDTEYFDKFGKTDVESGYCTIMHYDPETLSRTVFFFKNDKDYLKFKGTI
jgi:hypothetical protein